MIVRSAWKAIRMRKLKFCYLSADTFFTGRAESNGLKRILSVRSAVHCNKTKSNEGSIKLKLEQYLMLTT